MKNIKKVLLVVLSASGLFLYGCGGAEEGIPSEKTDSSRFNGISGNPVIVTDEKTGCKYVYSYNASRNGSTAVAFPLMLNSTEVDCGQED